MSEASIQRIGKCDTDFRKNVKPLQHKKRMNELIDVQSGTK